MNKDELAPRQVGKLKTVDLSGKLIPFVGGQPHFMNVIGSPHTYLPCFDNSEQLEGMMDKIGLADYTIKKIYDGAEFLSSIPREIKIALNFREMPDGKIRWTEIFRNHES